MDGLSRKTVGFDGALFKILSGAEHWLLSFSTVVAATCTMVSLFVITCTSRSAMRQCVTDKLRSDLLYPTNIHAHHLSPDGQPLRPVYSVRNLR